MAIVRFNQVSKFFKQNQVLDKLNLQIDSDKIVGLVGRNGVGKTTLLKIIAGFIKQSAGEVTVFNETPFNSLNVSANSIFIDDEMSFPNSLQLQELLITASKFYPNWDDNFAQRLFTYFNFDPSAYHHRLSKGKRSTFNAIIGLAARTQLTIFDEPTTGMDAAVRKDFYEALLKDFITKQRTIIISSHHLEEIDDLLEEIILLKNPQEIEQYDMDDFKQLAISLRGHKQLINEWSSNRELLYKKEYGGSQSYAIVKNNFSETELAKARLAGLQIAPVSANDTYIYLTANNRGGIDDVFKTS